MYMYTRMHIYYVCTYVCSLRMHYACPRLYTYVRTYVMYVYVCTYVYMFVCTYVYMFVCM